MNVILNLIPSLIIEAVKGETFLKGKIDKSADERASALAFNEQAGDEPYHERKLKRSMVDGLEKLKSFLSDFIDTTGGSISDNSIASEIDIDHDVLKITLQVTDRFNTGYTDSLARLSSRYIEDSMIYDWYAVFNNQLSQAYLPRIESDKQDIIRCFNKKEPKVPTYKYSRSITPKVGDEVVSSLSLVQGGSALLSYAIDERAIDDIEVKAGTNGLVTAQRTTNGFLVNAQYQGFTNITLYSRHDDSVKCVVNVTIRGANG